MANVISDILANSDFISRSIGMRNSYEDIMTVIQALGREPVSLLGKDYMYIFDHVRRNYNMGSNVINSEFKPCTKFTFYKEKPTVRFANPYEDPMNLKDRWFPDVKFESTSSYRGLKSYAESDDGYVNNKEITSQDWNEGINYGSVGSFANALSTCDMIKKTNENFNNGKYNTLIARFHTNSQDSKDTENITQTAISKEFGMSHGRNLLKVDKKPINGYDNPYCRVWTYHHQYNQLARAIRPFGDANSATELETAERGGYKTVGFRTIEDEKNPKFKGGSARLDKYGTLNYKNGLVNIAPTAKITDYFNDNKNKDKAIPIKRCMFSIENLAWKSGNVSPKTYDQNGLSAEQKGPFGGRIMWFPPYDLTFNESVNVNWNGNQFIGRGEKVYTYTDTERRGHLSFTLLIDHPSIIDYWVGRDISGGTRNSGGVDNTSNQENTLLRFFAGCDILQAKPQHYPKEDPKPIPPMPNEPKPQSKTKKIYCVLYYPNNYSGVDDTPLGKNSQVNAIHYLMNGIGAQKYVDDNNDAVDIPTQIDSCPSEDGIGHGGYELNGNISIVDEALEPDYNVIYTTYADTNTKFIKAQYLTTKKGTRLTVNYGNKDYTLAKYVGTQAMLLESAKDKEFLTGKSHLWYCRRWYYRVDDVYSNQELSEPTSYIDMESFGLNGSGYRDLLKFEKIAALFGIKKDDNDVTLISFASMFAALEGEKAKKIVTEGDYTEEHVQLVKNIKENPDRFKIKNITFDGHASYQGYDKKNKDLSRNRALTLKKWMMANGFPMPADIDETIKQQSKNDNVDTDRYGQTSAEKTKIWRSAAVIIEYTEESVDTAALSSSADTKTMIPNGKSSANNSTIEMSKAYMQNIWPSLANTINTIGNNSLDESTIRLMNRVNSDAQVYQDEQRKKREEENKNKNKNLVERYDNEGEFFKLLEREEPFLHNLITDKIKYFDPAFHSISPEGFNARLTFLHQCTRQGSTVGGSDTIPGTAYNLAFGRPPVCVLRIGDFYYTKIIINGLNITYDNTQWDLNPEGIGVMPMFAKIDIDFTFLGGSDLAGPISRLQNAVSFNYYANTSVYDNRSEMVEYEKDGSGKEVAFKPFTYPNVT